MNARLLFAMWTVFCANPDATVSETPFLDPVATIHYSYPPDGAQYASEITRELRDSSPDWEKAEPNPPLSARKAMSLAEATLRATLKDKSDPSYERYFSGAKLVPLGGKKWCWEVCYEWHDVRVGGATGGLYDFRVFVLMNGKVVQPVKVDRQPLNQETKKDITD
jgi:hypothetical protein